MADVSQAEAALVVAKTKCLKVCGNLDPTVASDLAEAAHEKHRAELEEAYFAFQRAGGEMAASNPATPGITQVKARLAVETGVN